MNFGHSYVLFGLIIPIVIVGVPYFLALALSRYFTRKVHSLPVYIVPVLLWLIAFLCCIVYLSSGYRYPICAILQNKSDRYNTIGYVENITDAPSLPIYYDSVSNKWSAGKLVTVNNQQYYMPFGDVEIGTAIDFIWGSDERVIYECSIKATVSDDEIGTRLVSSKVEPQPEPSKIKIGQIISTIFFGVFLIIAILLYVARNAVYNYLIERDKEITQKIIPNKIGLVECTLSTVLFLGISLGLMFSGFKEILLISAIYTGFRMVSTVKSMRRQLIINEDTIIVINGKKIKKYSAAEVTDIHFEPTRAPYSRCLVITFCKSLEVSFNQLYFWGLNSAYLNLKDRVQKTGDGSPVS